MKTRLFSWIVALFCMTTSTQADTILHNVYARNHTLLNGRWQVIVDPFDAGYYDYRLNESADGFFKNAKPRHKADHVEYDFTDAETLMVPGDWNTQSDRLFFYEGSVWYKRDFSYAKKAGCRTYLYFAAANYEADVYLNGQKLGKHIGGYTPFHYDITDRVAEGDNFVVVRVNAARHPEGVPTVNSDWWNYGGITRDVMLVETPEVSVDDYELRLQKGSYSKLCGYVQLSRPQEGVEVTLSVPELKVNLVLTTDASGRAAYEVKAKPRLWSPEQPKLYDVAITCGTEVIRDCIGFRHIETHGREVLLNGKPVFLRGISIHEEAPYKTGRCTTTQDDSTLLTWAKELGCNFVRLAHYPHNEPMVRMAERMGLMVWSEVPVYWTIHWDDANTYANASRQLKDNMDRDHNRCAIVVWSVANETPHSAPRDAFLKGLTSQVRERDDERLVSMAMEVTSHDGNTSKVSDNMSDYVDIVSFNSYLGWYAGKMDDLDSRNWNIPYEKPFFVSEFGAGAVAGHHGDKGAKWTEEYQADLYDRTLRMFNRVPGFAGTSPWILMDFRSARRQLHDEQRFFNRKGLISEKGHKKMAFGVLQDFYRQKAQEYGK
ncbi:MAG: glycoside hydrolase family 2 protein [Bacteroidaceae bacterium]